ncbi:MAG: ABC transporter, partial [Rhodospirillaceae bacterium]|nr:ABC transporter [Rhodospirillaceae bacterium]
DDHFYRLGAAPAEGISGALTGVIEVSRFIADGLAGRRPIVYTDGGDGREVQSYHYHFWSEPPPIMLQNTLVAYLRATNRGAQLVTPDMRVEPDYIISGKIRRFEQVLGPAGKIDLALELAVKRTRDDKMILLRPYSVTVATSNATVGEAVRRINQGLNAIYAKFLSDIPGR